VSRHRSTPRNLHVLLVIEEYVMVHRTVHSSQRVSRLEWRRFINEIAEPNTAIDEELRAMAASLDDTSEWTIDDILEDLTDIDLIEWWVHRKEGNAVHIFEVQDMTNTP
jgi:hypothetical protein